ncbi:MAG: glycosyltransferase [Paludibacteraceae bacterium]|nr:glycosyltransferase [Paludibacteraceae bacterium]
MDKPLVSVVIPCYNQSAFLAKAFLCLQQQTVREWECIVVDDGSSDDSAAIVGRYARADSRIHLLQKENGGSASARDMGLEKVQGQYLQFLDADDTIAPDKFEKQVHIMQQESFDLCYTAFCNEYDDGRKSPAISYPLSFNRVVLLWGMGASTPINSFLYRTAFLKQHNIHFSTQCRFREDWHFHINVFSYHPKTLALPEYNGATYFHHTGNKTSSYLKMQEGNFIFMAYMCRRFKGWTKALWCLRISEEVWMWLMRMVKYRSLAALPTIKPMYQDSSACVSLILAVCLLPISLGSMLYYYVKKYVLG